MDPNVNWIERQQRMVRCRKHGLHYDPKMASGCYLCVKEAAKRRKPSAPKFLVLLLCLFGMALVLFRVFGPELGPEEEALVGLEIDNPEANRTLDPEDYRSEVTAFERALFLGQTQSLDDLRLASGQIRSSARILRETFEDKDGDSVGAVVFAELERSIPEAMAFADLERLRDEWLRLRGRHLGSADWFHAPAGRSQGGSAQQRAAVSEYSDISRLLLDLLQDGNAQALALTSQPDAEEWRYFMDDWRERLNEIAARKPRRPRSGAHPQVLIGFERLEKAFGQARNVAGSTSSPQQAAGVFQQAASQAEEAVAAFDQAR